MDGRVRARGSCVSQAIGDFHGTIGSRRNQQTRRAELVVVCVEESAGRELRRVASVFFGAAFDLGGPDGTNGISVRLFKRLAKNSCSSGTTRRFRRAGAQRTGAVQTARMAMNVHISANL